MLEAEVVPYALEMQEGMRRVLRCILEALEGEACLLEVLDEVGVMRRMRLSLCRRCWRSWR